jgi:hypothetical protein
MVTRWQVRTAPTRRSIASEIATKGFNRVILGGKRRTGAGDS